MESNESTDAALSAEVRAEAARQKLTRAQIAEKAGMPYTAFCNRFQGRVPFTGGELIAVCNALGIEPHSLMARAEQATTTGTEAA